MIYVAGELQNKKGTLMYKENNLKIIMNIPDIKKFAYTLRD